MENESAAGETASGEPQWDKPVLDRIRATGVGLPGNEFCDNDAEPV
jgi:hypothetical protein